MSTTFGIIIKDGKELIDLPQPEDNIVTIPEDTEDTYYDVEEVYFRSNSNGGYWVNKLAQLLPKNTKVYALDNTPQGVFTIEDLIRE